MLIIEKQELESEKDKYKKQKYQEEKERKNKERKEREETERVNSVRTLKRERDEPEDMSKYKRHYKQSSVTRRCERKNIDDYQPRYISSEKNKRDDRDTLELSRIKETS